MVSVWTVIERSLRDQQRPRLRLDEAAVSGKRRQQRQRLPRMGGAGGIEEVQIAGRRLEVAVPVVELRTQ
jgi:hypothetical protein